MPNLFKHACRGSDEVDSKLSAYKLELDLSFPK